MARIRTAQFGSGTMNMEFLGLALQRNPQMLQELIVSKFGYLPMTSLLSGIYGDSPAEELIASNMLRWQVGGIPQKPFYVLSTSGDFRVGSKNAEITVTDSQLWAGATLRLEDGQTLLYVTDRKAGNGNSFAHSVQVVGNNELDSVDMTLLERGRALNYVTAHYEEGSATGHPIHWGTSDHYMGALNIQRHKFEITGDAITEAIIMEVQNPKGEMYQGWFPNIKTGGKSLIDYHMLAGERDLVWGKANFNFETGQIFNTTAGGKSVLMSDGLVRQMDQSPVWNYFPTDSASSIRQMLQRILVHMSYNQGQDTIEYIVTGGSGAKAVFIEAMRDYIVSGGGRINMTPEKATVKVANLDVTEFTTGFGSIKFVLSQAFNNPMQKTTEVTILGNKLPAESFDMYFFPVKRESNGKNNIRTFAKAKSVNGQMVNRSLVVGHIQGMTGFGLPTSDRNRAETAIYSNLIATGQDSEQFEVLSQKGLILTNPSECARLQVFRS